MAASITLGIQFLEFGKDIFIYTYPYAKLERLHLSVRSPLLPRRYFLYKLQKGAFSKRTYGGLESSKDDTKLLYGPKLAQTNLFELI